MEITRREMSTGIAVAKVQQVAALIRRAHCQGSHQAAVNERQISDALYFARSGRSTRAFRTLAAAKVPAGSIPACCGLRSAQYGFASHGYPRSI
jgi:hypothetical protein